MSETSSMLGKIATYTEELSRDPASRAFVPLSETYRKMGLVDDALEVAEKGVQRNPGYAQGHIVLARARQQAGDPRGAVADYHKALECDRESLAAMRGLVQLQFQQGQRQEAVPLLEKIVSLDPSDEKAKRLLEANRPVPEPTAAPAVEADPVEGGAPDALRDEVKPGPIQTATIAEIYFKQGLLEDALEVYRDLHEREPDNATFRSKVEELSRLVTAEQALPDDDMQTGGESQPAPPNVEEPQPTAEEGPERLVAEYGRWLEAIRKRREDVRRGSTAVG